MKRLIATALRTLTFAAPATALPTPISRREDVTMKTRLSSFVRRCALQVLVVSHKDSTMRSRLFSLGRRTAFQMVLMVAIASPSYGQTSVPGVLGNALTFDGGDDHVELPLIEAFNGNEYTIEAWVRVDAGWGQQATIFGHGLRLLHFGYNRVSFYGGSYQSKLLSHYQPNLLGQWHHIAAVFRKTSEDQFMAVYIDGTQAGHTNNVSSPTAHSGPAYIGAHVPTVSQGRLKGLIDEVRFWDVARTAAEIAGDMDLPLNGDEPGLIGLWHLDEQAPSDIASPVITLNGEAEMTVEVGAYTELGAVATPDPAFDFVVADASPSANDGVYYTGAKSVPVSISGSVGTAVGDYTLTYRATGAAGIEVTATRLVHVVSFGDAYGWEQILGSAVDLAVGGNGDVWMIGGESGNGIYEREGENWTQVSGYGQRIGVASDGTAWIVQDGRILRWDPATDDWAEVPAAGAGGAIDIGMGGGVWVVAEHTPGGEHAAFRWNAASYSWEATEGYTGKAIDVAPDGSAWMRLDDGSLQAFHAGASDWTGMPGDDVVDVALGYDGSAWCVTGNGEVHRWNASIYGWETVHGEGAAISVAPDGIAWVVRADGSIWRGVPGGRYQ